MILWFVATSIATVLFVFRDPTFDYRPLVIGSLLPDAVDVWFGGARAMHSVVVAVGAMAAVMLATIGRRASRRMLLGVPIGMLLHLVFDGAFSDVDVFWWPLTGSFGDAELPVVSRGWWNVAFEIVGAAMIAAGWRRFGFRSRPVRRAFVASGQLPTP